MPSASIHLENNICFVSGELNFSNVMSVYEKSFPLILNASQLTFDFSRLLSSDSSGLALIVEWLNIARRNHKKISLRAIPDYLLSIAKAARMEEMIVGYM